MTSASSDGVWTKDIEEAFEEALAIYPPCGRRKIILSDEGKMYGRNELIARYIKMRTGKHRSRKQVSSHIQVLSRKRAREAAGIFDESESGMGLVDDATARAVEGLAGLSALASPADSDESSPSPHPQSPVSPAGGVQKRAKKAVPNLIARTNDHAKAMTSGAYALIGLAHSPSASPRPTAPNPVVAAAAAAAAAAASGNGPKIIANPFAPPKMSLVDMVGFLEYKSAANGAAKRHSFVHLIGPAPFHDPHLETVDIKQIYDKFPGLKELYTVGPKSAFFLIKFWADLSVEQMDGFYGITSRYISDEDPVIKCSTKVCSFGKQVVEKIQIEFPAFDAGRAVYSFGRSQMCDYMVEFVKKLRSLPNKETMDTVLENFSVLQVVCNRDTNEILLCTAYVFEISSGPTQHHIYRLIE